jgi:hypothetical protein
VILPILSDLFYCSRLFPFIDFDHLRTPATTGPKEEGEQKEYDDNCSSGARLESHGIP